MIPKHVTFDFIAKEAHGPKGEAVAYDVLIVSGAVRGNAIVIGDTQVPIRLTEKQKERVLRRNAA